MPLDNRSQHSGRFGRIDPGIRVMVIGAVAALIGTAIGGLSVLGVVMAVTQTPDDGVRAVARNDGAAPRPAGPVIAAVPRSAPALSGAALPPAGSGPPSVQVPTPVSPPAAPSQVAQPAQVQAATPPPAIAPTPANPPPQQEPSAAAAAATPAPSAPPPKAWPDALTRRDAQAPPAATETDKPAPSPAAQSAAKDTDGSASQDVSSAKDASGAPATTRPSAKLARKRTPASAQTASDEDAAHARQPLFDTVGETPGGVTPANTEPSQAGRPTPSGARKSPSVRRQWSSYDSARRPNTPPVNVQQRRTVILQDQAQDPDDADGYSGQQQHWSGGLFDGLFGNWHRNDWQENRGQDSSQDNWSDDRGD